MAFWLAAIAAARRAASHCARLIGAYNYQIVILVGINIILAVSLNLINGVTGQFSIGHAGFYAVGGYTSAALVVYGRPCDPRRASISCLRWRKTPSCLFVGMLLRRWQRDWQALPSEFRRCACAATTSRS